MRWMALDCISPVDSWMHVLVGCNIGNENNGTFRCTRDGSFFFSFFPLVGEKVVMRRAIEQGGLVVR